MEYEGRRESGNIEDRRSMTKAGVAVGGAGSIIVVIVALLLGVDPRALLGPQGGAPPDGQPVAPNEDRDAQLKKFVAVVLADTEDVWHVQFKKMGKTYREPKLVLFGGQVQSACGFASAAVGPFYCPADERLYLDFDFFRELQTRFKAPGDFAQAYVIAHEVGHHVQNLLGTMDHVHNQQKKLSKTEANHLSVRLELQADFLAGVWAHHAQKAKHILEPGDLDEALKAARAIGDDRLQMEAQGRVVPDSFTHGTSAQRIRWFRRGFDKGDLTERDLLFTLPHDKL
jgi:hypothetical protein